MEINMEWVKGAIFDLDGTLIDSMGLWRQIDEEFLGKRGIDVPEDYSAQIAPMGVEETAIYTKKRFEFDDTIEDIIKEWYDMALDAYSNRIMLKPGAGKYLEFLKKRGVKLSIATASDIKLVIPVLTNNKVLDLFENITTIKEVDRGKGYPDVYIRAAQKMGLLPNECAVYEDILQGIKGANSGGFYTVGVYDYWSESDKDDIVMLADKYIENYEDLV